MDRQILHIDIDGCYASIELVYRPELRGRPVAVGGDVEMRHGIILAKNQEAKRFGIKTAEPIHQALAKCPELVILKPNHRLYESFARKVRAVYAEYTDRVEPFGLDEAWLDVTANPAMPGGTVGLARLIQTRVREELGVTVSVGVSFNKVFAKLGSDYQKPEGLTVIGRENFRSIVWPLPVEALLYVGPATRRKLNDRSVYTIGDLAAADPAALQSWLGKMGGMLGAFARGEDNAPVAFMGEESAMKSVGNSTTTPRDLTCERDASIVLLVLCESVAERLREGGYMARTVQLGLRDSSLQWTERQLRLENPTCTSDVLHEAALKLLRANWRWPKPVRAIGLRTTDLIGGAQPEQLTLFADAHTREKRERLERSVDDIRRRFGRDAIRRAAVTIDESLLGSDRREENMALKIDPFKRS